MSHKKAQFVESKPVDATRMARRLVARFHGSYDDALQDVHVSLLEHSRLYSGIKNPPCDENRWLYNKVWQQLRHRYTRLSRKSQAAPERQLPPDVADPSGSDPDAVLDVREALNRLSPAHRSILSSCGLEGRTLAEYAAGVGISASAASLLWAEATEAMRAVLPEYAT